MKPEQIALALVAVAVIVAAYYFLVVKKTSFTPYRGPAPLSSEKAQGKSLSLYGDSISVKSKLGELMPHVWFKNWAVAGTCLTDLINVVGEMRPFGEQLRADHSFVMVMRYGRNDAAFDRPLNVFQAMLVGFVTTCREQGKVPVLCSMVNEIFEDRKARERWLAVNNAILTVAGTMGVHYIDLTAVPFSKEELPDDVHPNEAYSDRVDDIIAKYLVNKQIFPA